MGAVDFTDWAFPDLELSFGGATYAVAPPDVARSRIIVALAVRSELRFGLVKGALPKELEDALEAIKDTPLGELTLGSKVYHELMEDNVPAVTIERMSYYAMWYWARGRERADQIAVAFWKQVEDDAPEDDASGEAPGHP